MNKWMRTMQPMLWTLVLLLMSVGTSVAQEEAEAATNEASFGPVLLVLLLGAAAVIAIGALVAARDRTQNGDS